MTNPHMVNLFQSAEDRQQKYWLLRSIGCNSSWARALRDWRMVKIEQYFNLQKGFGQLYLFSWFASSGFAPKHSSACDNPGAAPKN